MKKFKIILFLFILSATISGCSSTESDVFEQRLFELRQRVDTVATLLQQAEGLAQSAGLIDLQVAKYFADYIAWELTSDKKDD